MPTSSHKYELVFPDGHVIRFADFNESVNYIACKPFHKPLSFHGRIVDNLASWKIVVSPDRATYRIGIHFEKEIKMIPVEVVAGKLPQFEELPSLVFPFGSYFPNPGVWKVEGTEIVKLKAPIEIRIANNNNFAVKSSIYNGERLRIELSPLFRYDTTDLLSNLSKRFNHDVELTLSERKTGKSIAIFKSNLKVLFLPYNYNEVVLLIPGTEYTMASKAKFSPEGKIYPYEIKDKPCCEIIVKIDTSENPDLKLRLDKGKDVGIIKWDIVKENRKKEKSSRITGKIIEIKALPESIISIQVRLDGYKPISETITKYSDTQIPKIVTVIPELKLNKRIFLVLKEYVQYIITGIVCLIAGFIIGRQTHTNPIEKQDVTITNTSIETDKLTNKSDLITEDIDTCVSVSEIVELPKEDNRNNSQLAGYQQNLIRNLKGTKFTRKDVDRARKELRGVGYDDLISDAEACLRIINLRNSLKEELMYPRSSTYDLTIGKLNHHKDIMMKIIHSSEYLAISRTDFNSIEEICKYIDKMADREMKSKTSQDVQSSTKVNKSFRKI